MVETRSPRLISKAARNEQRKALATTCNAVSVALFISTGIQPLMAGRLNIPTVVVAGAAFIALQLLLHYILRQLED